MADEILHGTDLLSAGLKDLSYDFDDKQVHMLMEYFEMVVRKNEVMNLTAITQTDEFIVKHFFDSLTVPEALKAMLNKGCRVIDVGTGAGFPGIPLKIMFPKIEIVLLDSLAKRLNFLEDVIDNLGLQSCTTLHSRAEDAGRNKDTRESFDLCVSRAVSNMSTLSEYCLPLVKKGGIFAPYKSSSSGEEINAAKKAISLLGGKLKGEEVMDVPYSDIKRITYIVEKEKATPDIFPRKAGTPSKKPL